MTAWTLIGDLYSNGMPGKLEWRDGRLEGTTEALADADAVVAAGDPIGVTPTGPFIKADKTDELSAFVIARYVLSGTDVSGTPPELPLEPLPDGAIA